jgi:hypothetical protein
VREICSDPWAGILAANGLADFNALWDLPRDWFEPPNERRGGWSGVSRHRLRLAGGGEVGVFVKRQQDHCFRSLRHPLRGRPTFEREWRNIQSYRACGVPTLEPVYFGWRRQDGHQRAILITRELEGFRSLLALQRQWSEQGRPPRARRRALLEVLSASTRRMHACGLQHNCFYPKHLFLRPRAEGWELRVIDLEKTKRRRRRDAARVRDLSTLGRYAQGWSRSERLGFFLSYLQRPRLDRPARRLLKKVLRDMSRKQA